MWPRFKVRLYRPSYVLIETVFQSSDLVHVYHMPIHVATLSHDCDIIHLVYRNNNVIYAGV